MTKMIDSVWNICNEFIKDGRGRYVTLNEKGMQKVAEDISGVYWKLYFIVFASSNDWRNGILEQ